MSTIDKNNIGLPIIILLSLAVMLAGCLKPQIITDSGSLDVNAAATDASAFIRAGCIDTGNGRLDCSSIGLEDNFSCQEIMAQYDLGGLSPKVPIVACNVLLKDDGMDKGIVRQGCLYPMYRRYIIIDEGKYRPIEDKEGFIQYFAPVESPEEALAFAVALTNSRAAHNMTLPEGNMIYSVSSIRTTYVERIDAGFKVHLFYQQFCGCGNHPYFSIDYAVTRDGEVNEISSEKIYENPELFGLCVD